MSLAENLKIAREYLGKSQKEMASAVGSAYRSWQGYEQGTSTPGGKIFVSLAEIGFNINWILTGEGKMMIDASHRSAHVDMARDVLLGDPEAAARREARVKEFLKAKAIENDAPYSVKDIDLAAGMQLLGKIYSSGDQVLIRAINANLQAFGAAIDDRARAEKAVQVMQDMEKRIKTLEEKSKNCSGGGDLGPKQVEGAA